METMTLWTDSEIAEVDQLCKTLPLVEAWSLVAKDKIDKLQERVAELELSHDTSRSS